VQREVAEQSEAGGIVFDTDTGIFATKTQKNKLLKTKQPLSQNFVLTAPLTQGSLEMVLF